jgi:hypothetical protein
MYFKGLAAAVFLCITLTSIFSPASAEESVSHSPLQFQLQQESPAMPLAAVIKAPAGNDDSVVLNMLEVICIVGLAVAGLVLLKKIQAE